MVIGIDIFWFIVVEGGEVLSEDWFFVELSSGVGVVVILVSDVFKIF